MKSMLRLLRLMKKGRVDASMKALLPRPPKPERSDEKGKSLRWRSSPPTSSQGPQT